MPTYTIRGDGYRVATFTANETFVIPAGVSSLKEVLCRGLSGNGGSATVNGGGGGGGGALARISDLAVTEGASFSVVVPAAGGAADTSFGTVCIAKPGGNGVNGNAVGHGAGGAGGTAAASTATGGSSTAKFSGGAGAGPNGGADINGGVGGGGAGTTASAAGQTGGANGGGNGGATGGGAGNFYGGGGGGGSITGAGGAGVRGEVILTYVETGVVPSVTTYTKTEAIADTAVSTSVTSLAALEAIADGGVLSTVAVQTALEALAEIGGVTSLIVPTANWQRISPGLSGIVYDSAGSTPVVGAQVLIFRDDTNALIATLTSDATGLWATDLDSAFTYWISGHKAGTPQVEDRTDRAIPTVETIVETGT